MGKLQVSGQDIACNYDFVIDPTAGATGTIALDGILPVNAILRRFVAFVLTPFTSGGAATISFGLRQVGVAAPISRVTLLAPAQVIAFYNATDQDGNAIARPGNDFNANPLKLYTGWEVVMAIGGAALTAGAIGMHIEYSIGTV
jgi:hypothetical protein